MANTPKYDAKVKEILNAMQPGERICELTGDEWMMDEEEISWYKKFNVPPSKRSPQTRWWVETGWFTSYQWWWNKNAETGEPILTFIHPATGLRVLPDKIWFDRDYIDKGRTLVIDQPFFEQLRALQLEVPVRAEHNEEEPQNSIARFSLGDVNSYFNMFCTAKNSLFSMWVLEEEDSAEVFNSVTVTNSFNISDSQKIFNCKFIRGSRECMDSAFLFDCRGCQYCFGATNKRNRKFIFFNEQLSEAEYRTRVDQIDFSKRSVINEYYQKYVELIKQEGVWPENFNEQAVNCTGEYLTKVNDNKFGYGSVNNVHDTYWVNYGTNNTFDSAFCSGMFSSNNCFYSTNTTRSSKIRYSYHCTSCQDLEYCIDCCNCESCFGCVGLNHKKFCILNQQYSEEEYWQLVDELKCKMFDAGEYGEFFPSNMATSYFPDSGATLYFDCPIENDKKFGALEFDPESEGAIGEELSDTSKMRDVTEVPDCIDDFKDEEWLGIPLYDPNWKRRFAYLKPEIEFYRKHRIGPPQQHFISRMQDIFKQSNAGKFIQASCAECQKQVTAAENVAFRGRKILCREHYLKYLETNG